VRRPFVKVNLAALLSGKRQRVEYEIIQLLEDSLRNLLRFSIIFSN
jgi:hypothetical protein